jgi:hypothetical protein
MSVLAMMFLIYVFMRFARSSRVRRGHCGGHFAWHPPRQPHRLRHERPVAEPQAPKLSAFDALKERYVRGAISDAQYESELDQLLQTPEGRSQVL